MNIKRNLTILIVLAALLVSVAAASAHPAGLSGLTEPAGPVGPGFTYQGQLKDDAGSPVNDTCDFRFTLWDSTSALTPIGSESLATGIVVTDGYFTARVNASNEFGSTAFVGEPRYLGIGVRCPSGSGDYTVLSPRQRLDIAPMAGYAVSASWKGLTDVPAGFADNVDDNTTYSAGDGLSLSGGQFSVSFSGSGSADTASRSDHNHWGASWSGTGPGLTLSGDGNGVYATVSSAMGVGFYGVASSSTGGGIGVLGRTASTGGYGVWGDATATSGTNYGVRGTTSSWEGSGVYGLNTASGGFSAHGVYGETNSNVGSGVYGHNTAADAQAYGVYGKSESQYGYGVMGEGDIGVGGKSGTGVGVYGFSYNEGDIGVLGSNFEDNGIGVFGSAWSGIGIEANSVDGIALAATGSGVISSTADTEVYLSPFTAMRRDSFTDLTFTPLDNGGVRIEKVGAGTGERLVVVPISTAGIAFGTPVYIKSLEICYKTSATVGYITSTGAYKGNNETYSTYLSSGTDHSSTARECYTIEATTRRMIDNSSYVQIHLYFTNTTEPDITIFTVKVILSEMTE